MAHGNGEPEVGDVAPAPAAVRPPAAARSERLPKATDLPPLRSWTDHRAWIGWTFAALAAVIILAMAVNALDFSRRQELLERRLDIAIDQRDALETELDNTAGRPSPDVTPTTVTVSPTEEFLADSRARGLDLREQALDDRAVELDARETDLLVPIPSTLPGGAAPSFGSGVLVVGTDIETGVYRTDAPAGCTYRKIGPGDRVLFSDERSDGGPVTVDIGAEVERFDSDGCGIWTAID